MWCKSGAVRIGVIGLNRSKNPKSSVRLSVSLDQSEYAELSKLAASLDLSAAWMIRRAVSEFVARHRDGIETDLPLRPPGTGAGKKAKKKTGGSNDK